MVTLLAMQGARQEDNDKLSGKALGDAAASPSLLLAVNGLDLDDEQDVTQEVCQ